MSLPTGASGSDMAVPLGDLLDKCGIQFATIKGTSRPGQVCEQLAKRAGLSCAQPQLDAWEAEWIGRLKAEEQGGGEEAAAASSPRGALLGPIEDNSDAYGSPSRGRSPRSSPRDGDGEAGTPVRGGARGGRKGGGGMQGTPGRGGGSATGTPAKQKTRGFGPGTPGAGGNSPGGKYGASPRKGGDRDLRKLFVGGLPNDVEESKLAEVFATYGKVVEVEVKRDARNGRSRGFGFVNFATAAQAKEAAKQKKLNLWNRTVEVQLALPTGDPSLVHAKPVEAGCKIFVGGLSQECTERDLTDHFSWYGDVTASEVKRDHSNGRSRGFGFVTFLSAQSADEARKAPAPTICGKQVEVLQSVMRGDPALDATPRGPDLRKKVFVGGLPQSVTEETLRQHFSVFGEVLHTEIKRDFSNERSRGFGFVLFANDQSADAAIQVNRSKGIIIDGKQVEVQQTLKKGDPVLERRAQQGGPAPLSPGFFSSPPPSTPPKQHGGFPGGMGSPDDGAGGGGGGGGPREDRIFVGGLPPDVTNNDLYEAFSRFGDVVSAEVKASTKGGKGGKGFGFVHFRHSTSARQALDNRYHVIGGKHQVEIKPAIGREGTPGGRGQHGTPGSGQRGGTGGANDASPVRLMQFGDGAQGGAQGGGQQGQQQQQQLLQQMGGGMSASPLQALQGGGGAGAGGAPGRLGAADVEELQQLHQQQQQLLLQRQQQLQYLLQQQGGDGAATPQMQQQQQQYQQPSQQPQLAGGLPQQQQLHQLGQQQQQQQQQQQVFVGSDGVLQQQQFAALGAQAQLKQWGNNQAQGGFQGAGGFAGNQQGQQDVLSQQQQQGGAGGDINSILNSAALQQRLSMQGQQQKQQQIHVGGGYPGDAQKNMLFVGSLPPDCTRDVLFREFSRMGSLVGAEVMADPATGASKGFVEFADAAVADAWLGLPQVTVAGQDVMLSRVGVQAAPPQQMAQQPQVLLSGGANAAGFAGGQQPAHLQQHQGVGLRGGQLGNSPQSSPQYNGGGGGAQQQQQQQQQPAAAGNVNNFLTQFQGFQQQAQQQQQLSGLSLMQGQQQQQQQPAQGQQGDQGILNNQLGDFLRLLPITPSTGQ